MPPPEYCGPPGARFKHNNIVDPVVPVPAADAPRSADALPRPASKQPPRRRHLPIRHLPTAASRHLPPRYSPFPDGAWRRVDSYTLVGSTICDSCTTAPTPAQQMGAAPAPDLDPDDFAASIPSGWVHDSVASTARTNLTIGLSLVLAGFIVITIVRCHFWRAAARTARRRARADDPERRRAPRARPGTPTPESAAPQTPVRRWMARATARWRDNARYLARQRRGRRGHHHHSRRGSVESLVLPAAEPPAAASDAAEPESVFAASASTLALALHDAARTGRSVGTGAGTSGRSGSRSVSVSRSRSRSRSRPRAPVASTSAPPSPPPVLTPLPPAYPARPARPPPRDGKAPAAFDEDAAPGGFADDSGEAHPPYTRYAPSINSSDLNTTAFPGADSNPFESAHVATDDKRVLARLAARASAPSLAGRRGSGGLVAGAGASSETMRSQAPTVEELELEFGALGGGMGGEEGEGGGEGGGDGAGAEVDAPPFPAPPPPTGVDADGDGGARSEKRALERAYAHEARASCSSPPPAAPSFPPPPPPRAVPSYWDADADAEGEGDDDGWYGYASAPSAPSYPVAAFGEEREGVREAEAGPSTPRRVENVSASAPPWEWGVGEEGMGEEGSAPPFEEDEREEGGGGEREEGEGEEGERAEEADRAGEQEQQQQNDAGNGDGEERAREQDREARRASGAGAGAAHDTGWEAQGGDEGAGQRHDR